MEHSNPTLEALQLLKHQNLANREYYNRIELPLLFTGDVQEHATIGIKAGRQCGKTEAILKMAKSGDVIIVANHKRANAVGARISLQPGNTAAIVNIDNLIHPESLLIWARELSENSTIFIDDYSYMTDKQNRLVEGCIREMMRRFKPHLIVQVG